MILILPELDLKLLFDNNDKMRDEKIAKIFFGEITYFRVYHRKMSKNYVISFFETNSASGLSKIYFYQDLEIRRIRFCGEEKPIY